MLDVSLPVLSHAQQAGLVPANSVAAAIQLQPCWYATCQSATGPADYCWDKLLAAPEPILAVTPSSHQACADGFL